MSSRSILALIVIATGIAAGSLAMRRGGMESSPGAAPFVAAAEDSTIQTAAEAEPPAEAVALLEAGRPWRAARVMAGYLRSTRVPSAEAILFAARAEAGWGGWKAARGYLEGKPWLDELDEGEGWYWLGRAREEDGELAGAVEAYDRFLTRAGGGRADSLTLSAELRLGLLRLRGGTDGDEDPLRRVIDRAPFVADWLRVLSAEALAEAGDTAGVRSRLESLEAEDGIRHRARVALVRAFEAAGDGPGLIRTAVALREAGGTATQRAELSLIAGRAARAAGDDVAARREWLRAIGLAPGSSAARDAATLLLELPGLSVADRLAIADIDDRHGNRGRAAEGYRAWLSAGTGSADQREDVQLRLGRALFNAGLLAESETTLRPLLDGRPAVAREALYLTGRSQYRRGERQLSFSTFESVAARYPGSAEGSEALYLVADLTHDDGNTAAASTTYRRVASNFRGTDRAGLSLMRLAGIRYHEGDLAGAAAVWEEYRSSYPRGERWLQSTYWAGRAYEELGDHERARTLYQAVRRRDELSYYTVLASERLGVPYWPVPLSASPPADPLAAARVEELLRGVDLLRSADLHGEAEAEADLVISRAGNDTGTLYALAEALNDRGYSIRGIRIGQGIQRSAGLNLRLLRILYPFPYRAIVEAEAEEKGLDPYIVAALMRQESLFTARISSPVGARGLMQIMPETGRALASGVGIDEWDSELLFQPEINVHLGTRYLAEQMERYDESLPSVFSAYNAGPHRIDDWKEFPEFGDEELFTERIPYRETRDYVKILTRNIELYRGLYAGEQTAATDTNSGAAGGDEAD
jgi:soluble lytic murein transglycosylase